MLSCSFSALRGLERCPSSLSPRDAQLGRDFLVAEVFKVKSTSERAEPEEAS
jgi:hypothetical protein